MKAYILTLFVILAIDVLAKILSMVDNTYKRPRTIGIYAADTVLNAALLIWAGFVLWY